MNFLHNFDPETSERERRKLKRKSYFMKLDGSTIVDPTCVRDSLRPRQYSGSYKHKNKAVFNERGQIASTGKDLCDCLDETCPGCHFPCKKCSSNKCGHECRANRKWKYDKIDVEGNDFATKNEKH